MNRQCPACINNYISVMAGTSSIFFLVYAFQFIVGHIQFSCVNDPKRQENDETSNKTKQKKRTTEKTKRNENKKKTKIQSPSLFCVVHNKDLYGPDDNRDPIKFPRSLKTTIDERLARYRLTLSNQSRLRQTEGKITPTEKKRGDFDSHYIA